jgi:hypothetical protein
MPTLTTPDKALFAIHSRTWRFPGELEQAVFEATGLRSTAAWQRLNELLDTEAALAHAPVTVRRLQRIRASRLRRRVG